MAKVGVRGSQEWCAPGAGRKHNPNGRPGGTPECHQTQVSLDSALSEEHGCWFSKLVLPGAHVLGVPLGTL